MYSFCLLLKAYVSLSYQSGDEQMYTYKGGNSDRGRAF